MPVLRGRVAEEALGGETKRCDRCLQLVYEVGHKLLAHPSQVAQLGDVGQEHQRLALAQTGDELDDDVAAVMDEMYLRLVGVVEQSAEQVRLEGHLDETCRQSRWVDAEEDARLVIGGHDVVFRVEQESYHGRVLEQRRKWIVACGAQLRMLICTPIPDHGRSIGALVCPARLRSG